MKSDAKIGVNDVATLSDEELMLAYIDDDERAFRVLFERYAPALLRLARRHLREDDLAREIVQQTFFRIHRARNDFRRDARVKPWVMTIAMNQIREHWRRSKRRNHSELHEESIADELPTFSNMELEQRSTLLHDALSKLPATQREVVELHWLQEQPYAEVAKIVGTSEGAVRVRAHRAYTTLKTLLGLEIGS